MERIADRIPFDGWNLSQDYVSGLVELHVHLTFRAPVQCCLVYVSPPAQSEQGEAHQVSSVRLQTLSECRSSWVDPTEYVLPASTADLPLSAEDVISGVHVGLEGNMLNVRLDGSLHSLVERYHVMPRASELSYVIDYTI